jgi:hypothetical protein
MVYALVLLLVDSQSLNIGMPHLSPVHIIHLKEAQQLGYLITNRQIGLEDTWKAWCTQQHSACLLYNETSRRGLGFVKIWLPEGSYLSQEEAETVCELSLTSQVIHPSSRSKVSQELQGKNEFLVSKDGSVDVFFQGSKKEFALAFFDEMVPLLRTWEKLYQPIDHPLAGQTPLEELRLPPRVHNALFHHLSTLEEVLQTSELTFLGMRSLGPKGIQIIVECLKQSGIFASSALAKTWPEHSETLDALAWSKRVTFLEKQQ